MIQQSEADDGGGAPSTEELTRRIERLESLAAKGAFVEVPQLLSDSEAAIVAGIGRSTLRALVAEGKFPKPVRVPGRRSTRWRRSDVVRWIEQRK